MKRVASTRLMLTSVILASAAMGMAQDKIKIEPNWDKDSKIKLKQKFDFQIGEHHAQIDGLSLWTGSIEDDNSNINVHHDELTIVADDKEVNPPFDDFKITFNKLGSVTKFIGGIDGSDGLRMLLVGHFFAPKTELTKDTVSKWTVPTDSRMAELHDLNIETTFLGTVEVGKQKGFRFKQVVVEDKGEFGTEGAFTVNEKGQVLKAEVNFRGMPIPAAGGAAKGKYTAALVE